MVANHPVSRCWHPPIWGTDKSWHMFNSWDLLKNNSLLGQEQRFERQPRDRIGQGWTRFICNTRPLLQVYCRYLMCFICSLKLFHIFYRSFWFYVSFRCLSLVFVFSFHTVSLGIGIEQIFSSPFWMKSFPFFPLIVYFYRSHVVFFPH